VADKAAGLHAVYGLLAALLHRERTGEGQLVEVPMFESLVAWNLVEHLYGQVHVPKTAGWGYTRVLTKHRRPFPTKDSFIAILPYTEKHWPLFFEVAGRPELWDSWRGKSRQDRTTSIGELYALVVQLTSEKTTAEWMELLDRHDIPCMRVNRLEDLPSDPHLASVGFFEEHQHPTEGRYLQMRHPVRFGRCETPLRSHPSRHGADAHSVLAELDLEAELDALLDEGAIRLPDPTATTEPPKA
jgi:formyl-CoA transferase